MARNFKELQAKMSPERRANNEIVAREMIAEMPLDELREACELTQEQLGRILRVNQAAVSKMERRADMYISTLHGIIKAMGGDLEIRAVFSDGEVRINQFGNFKTARVRRNHHRLVEAKQSAVMEGVAAL